MTLSTRLEVTGTGFDRCDTDRTTTFLLAREVSRCLSGVWGELGTVVIDRYGRVCVDVSRGVADLTSEYLTNCGFGID